MSSLSQGLSCLSVKRLLSQTWLIKLMLMAVFAHHHMSRLRHCSILVRQMHRWAGCFEFCFHSWSSPAVAKPHVQVHCLQLCATCPCSCDRVPASCTSSYTDMGWCQNGPSKHQTSTVNVSFNVTAAAGTITQYCSQDNSSARKAFPVHAFLQHSSLAIRMHTSGKLRPTTCMICVVLS